METILDTVDDMPMLRFVTFWHFGDRTSLKNGKGGSLGAGFSVIGNSLFKPVAWPHIYIYICIIYIIYMVYF